VKAGLSQARLAEEVSRTATTVRRWEHGEATPAGDVLDPLATALHVELSDLEPAWRAATDGAMSATSTSEVSSSSTGSSSAVLTTDSTRTISGETGAIRPAAAVSSGASRDGGESAAVSTDPTDPVPTLQSSDPNAVAEIPVIRVPAARATSTAEAASPPVAAPPAAAPGEDVEPWFDVPTEPVPIATARAADGTAETADASQSLSARALVEAEQPVPTHQVLVLEPSYVEDRRQKLRYGARFVLTIAFLAVAVVVLVWAFRELFEALGDVIELFQEPPEPEVPTSTPLGEFTG
jgi:hypothetical protein